MKIFNWKHLAAALALGTAVMAHSGIALAVNVGDKAPAFSLPATIGKQAGLASYPGKTVVLFFYTGAFTNA
jgi:hypothetical protein